MFRRIFAAALGAGIAVGIAVAVLQQATLVPLILTAETYESGAAAVHRHGALAPAGDHSGTMSLVTPAEAHEAAAPHDASEASPWRAVLTFLATTVTSVGFALLLAGAFAVSGRDVDGREGLLWGLAGYAAFTLAPAFGLPPELPGSVAADLLSRQIWWVATAAATLAGLGLLAFVRTSLAVPVALALLAAPHLVGAPHPHTGAGLVPPELAASFAARALGVDAVFWALLGLSTGALYRRFGRAQAA
jgi:cobalt transporter subunit CbtA